MSEKSKEPLQLPKKSSNEILSELFEAFNVEPPIIVTDLATDSLSISNKVDKAQKKPKKSKKRHKTSKRRKRSDSASSENEDENDQKPKKKHKKHKIKSTSEIQDKKKQKKKKSKKDKKPKKSASENLDTGKHICDNESVKDELGAVKNVDKTKDLNTVTDTANTDPSGNINFETAIKPEPGYSPDSILQINLPQLNKTENEGVIDINVKIKLEKEEFVDVKKQSLPTVNGPPNLNNDVNVTSVISVADAFVEGCLESGVKPEKLAPEKKKLTIGSKITIKNLKNSTVFEETVRQVEEQARLKAEKYEEGEISDSSESECKSVSHSASPAGSLSPLCVIAENAPVIKSKESSKKRSRSKEKRSSKSRHRSHLKHRRSSKDTSSQHRSRSQEKHKSSRDKSRSKSPSKHTSKKSSRKRSRTRSRSKSEERRKDRSSSSNRKKYSSDLHKHRHHHHHNSSSSSRRSLSPNDRDRGHRSRRYRKRYSESKSRSRSRTRSRSVSRSKDSRRQDGQEKIDKRRLLEIARKNALNMLKQNNATGTVGIINCGVEQTKATIAAGGKTVDELTDFCKLLSKKDAEGHESISSNTSNTSDSESEKPFHHPFQLKDRPQNIVMNIRNSVAVPVKTLQEKTAEQSKALRLQFPVSSGQLHRKKESDWVPVSPKKGEQPVPQLGFDSASNDAINILPATAPPMPASIVYPGQQTVVQPEAVSAPALPQQQMVAIQCPPNQQVPIQNIFPAPVPPEQMLGANMHFSSPQSFENQQAAKTSVDITSAVTHRLSAMKRLQENPNDIEAMVQMNKAQQQAQAWVQSKFEPGQFTGSTGARVLSQAELASGLQAWARKDQFNIAAPVQSGMGMAMLQKMGWRPGEGLGKNKEGTLEPLKLLVKMDKKGLVAPDEVGYTPPVKNITKNFYEGKHPVSLLNELCSRKRYGPPIFDCCYETGPDHKKNFLFKVTVNGIEYKPSVASQNKKHAKVEAATLCLRALGHIY